jgi:hypothetical protein
MDATFSVNGEGFAPNEQVVVRIGTLEVAHPVANEQGVFKAVGIGVPDFYAPFSKPITVDVIAQSKPDFQFHDSKQIRIT